jgi:hypothetical protein
MTISNLDSGQLEGGLKEIRDFVANWAIPLAAIGTLSMALLQTAKNLLPMRARYQRRFMKAWIAMAVSGFPSGLRKHADAASAGGPTNADLAETDLINLAASGDSEAFYSLEAAQMCTQIRNVTSVLLDYPAMHERLLFCLVSQSQLSDFRKVLSPPDHKLLSSLPHEHSEADKKHIKEYAAAKSRLAAQMRCNIDAIQASIEFRWKRSMQILSLALCAVIGVVALIIANNGVSLADIWGILLIAVISGVLAPVARDLAAAVENWRS